jgi:hypothetical protein
MPRSPLAQSPGRQVVQHLLELVPGEPSGELFLRIRIGKQVFDGGEPGSGGGVEPVEKIELVPQHREIGGELRHRLAPALSAASS